MNISNLLNFTAFGNNSLSRPAQKSVQDLSPLAQAVQRADARLATEVAANTAQLSSLGKLKSSVADVQTAAEQLANISATSKPADIYASVENLARTFNAVTTVNLTTPDANAPSELARSTKRVASDLMEAVTSEPSHSADLRSLGLKPEGNVLHLSSSALAEALANTPDVTISTLKEFGTRLNAAASAELDQHSNLTDSLAMLGRASQVLQAQQSALQSATLATSTYADEKRAGSGLKAYLSNIG